MKTVHEQIMEVMDGFDFRKIHESMTKLNWTWACSDGGRIPTIEELKFTAYSLMFKVMTTSGMTRISTGGFVARKDGDDLTLYFRIDEATNKTYE